MERWIHAVGGAVGGAVGTAFMQAGMKLDPKLPEAAQAPKLRSDPGDFLVQQGERTAGVKLPKDTHETVAHSLHWTYGVGWGALLGMTIPRAFARSLPETMLAGAGMGAACWAAGYVGWLPAAGLAAPIHRQGATHAASSLATHLIFGVLSALPIYALSRMLRPKRLFGFL